MEPAQFFIFSCVVQFEKIQSQGIADHAEAGQAHRCRAEHGVEFQAEQGIEHACR